MVVSDQLHELAASPPVKEFRDRRLMDHKAGLKAVKPKSPSLTGNRILATQPVARRYIDCTILADIVYGV